MATRKPRVVTVTPKQTAVVRGDDLRVVYANQAAGSITPWDFAMRFGRIEQNVTNAAGDGTAQVRELVHVYMSPQHAKAFLDLMKRQVGAYEAKYGPIPDPNAVALKKGE